MSLSISVVNNNAIYVFGCVDRSIRGVPILFGLKKSAGTGDRKGWAPSGVTNSVLLFWSLGPFLVLLFCQYGLRPLWFHNYFFHLKPRPFLGSFQGLLWNFQKNIHNKLSPLKLSEIIINIPVSALNGNCFLTIQFFFGFSKEDWNSQSLWDVVRSFLGHSFCCTLHFIPLMGSFLAPSD